MAKWESTNNYPDGYTYFAIEHTPARYADTYSVVDTKDEDGKVTGQTITIENRPVKLEEGQTLGGLSVQKAVKGLPDTEENRNKTYRFRIKNGSKYLVETGTNENGTPTYELLSLAEMSKRNPALTLERDATYTIQAGADHKRTFGGLFPAVYTIEEVGNPQVPGFTLETTYSRNGRIGVNLDQTSEATITNTYTPEETRVIFGKIWADGDNKPLVWPEDQSIQMVVHRSVKGVDSSEDTNFALTYNVTKDTATLTTDAGKSKVPSPEVLDNAKIEVIQDNAAAPYYAYRYQLSGLSKKVLTGTHAGEEWVYYVTEIPPAGAAFEIGYGSLNGTAVSLVNGKKNAWAKAGPAMPETEYVINKLSAKEISFHKNWFDGVNAAALTAWPQREKARELDGDGNVVNPDVPAQYEDVPISVTLRRTLEYQDGLLSKTETGYDPNFEVTFNNLTSSVTAREQTTSEGKLTLAMTRSGSDVAYTVAGLKEKGSLDGQTGEWKYYIVESSVDGYAASYLLAGGRASGGVFTGEGGTIQNTKKLGTIVVEKKAQGLPESEKNKTFSIVVKNSEEKYLTTGGTLTDTADDAAVRLKANEKAVFNHVPAGSYKVEELGTGMGGAAQVYGYTLDVSVDHNGAVDIADDAVKNVTITNTYAPDTTDFEFTKVWYGVDWEHSTEWATDAITVTLNRTFVPAASESEASGAGQKKTVVGDPITMTLYPSGGQSTYAYTVEKVTDPSMSYSMTITGLEKWVPEKKLPAGVTSGQWTYTLQETVPAGYYANYFLQGSEDYHGVEAIDTGGKIENHLITEELPSTGGPGTALIYLLGIALTGLAGTGLRLKRMARTSLFWRIKAGG